MLKDAAGSGYPDGDEDHAAPVPELQPDQGQGDANGADADCCGEVGYAEGDGNQQESSTRLTLLSVAVLAASPKHERKP